MNAAFYSQPNRVLQRSGTSFAGSLDGLTTDLQAAWSLNRKLLSSWGGGAFDVIRASDNDEKTIGFVNGEMDVADLLSFCAGTDGKVVRIFDETGGGKPLEAPSDSERAVIVSGGALQYVIGTQAKTTMQVLSALANYRAAFGSQQTPAAVTFSGVMRVTEDGGGYNGHLEGPDPSFAANGGIFIWQPDTANVQPYIAFSVRGNPVGIGAGSESILGSRLGPTNVAMCFNGNADPGAAYTPTFSFNRFQFWVSSLNTGGAFAEAALWFGDHMTDMQTWQLNQVGYYGL